MRTFRRQLLVLAGVLVLLAGQAAGVMHLCHIDASHKSQESCVLCACASTPVIASGHEPVVATLVTTRRVLILPAPVPPRVFYSTPLSSRAPPSSAIA